MLAVQLRIAAHQIDNRVKLANEVTFKRMKDTMEKLRDTPAGELATLAQILLGQTRPAQVRDLVEVKFIDETLNDSQKEAVRFCLSAPDIALIHGPPGVLSPTETAL
jgi:DNA polymerase alpha-associated DNA helicase A